jgi:hypothetical protein
MWSSQHLHVTQGDILVPMGSSPLTHQPWLGLRSSLPIYALLSNSLSLPAHVSLSLSLSPWNFYLEMDKNTFYIMYKPMVWIVIRMLLRITFILQQWWLRMDILLTSML